MEIDVYEDDDNGEDFDSGTELTCRKNPSPHLMLTCGVSLSVRFDH